MTLHNLVSVRRAGYRTPPLRTLDFTPSVRTIKSTFRTLAHSFSSTRYAMFGRGSVRTRFLVTVERSVCERQKRQESPVVSETDAKRMASGGRRKEGNHDA